VAAAARIAAALGDDWKKLQLYRIVLATAAEGEVPAAPTFNVLTREGAQVIWGHAPGDETSGEATASEKLTVLRKYYETNGPLVAGGEHRELNLRSGPAATAASFRK
jgi:hypothetical protein